MHQSMLSLKYPARCGMVQMRNDIFLKDRLVSGSTNVQLNGEYSTTVLPQRHWERRAHSKVYSHAIPFPHYKSGVIKFALVATSKNKQYHSAVSYHAYLPIHNHPRSSCKRISSGLCPRLRPRSRTSLLLCRNRQWQRYLILLQWLHRRQPKQL